MTKPSQAVTTPLMDLFLKILWCWLHANADWSVLQATKAIDPIICVNSVKPQVLQYCTSCQHSFKSLLLNPLPFPFLGLPLMMTGPAKPSLGDVYLQQRYERRLTLQKVPAAAMLVQLLRVHPNAAILSCDRVDVSHADHFLVGLSSESSGSWRSSFSRSQWSHICCWHWAASVASTINFCLTIVHIALSAVRSHCGVQSHRGHCAVQSLCSSATKPRPARQSKLKQLNHAQER